MVFSDLFFLFAFLPAFLLCYLLAARIDHWQSTSPASTGNVVKNVVLTLFSLIFYAWGEPVYVLLMLLCVLLNYMAGLVIDRSNRHRKTALVLGLVCNLALLGTFKYATFFAQTLSGWGIPIPVPSISLPIGISFYTFQSISYLVDVYRRESPAQRRFVDLLLYVSMFPQLIAGPIVRYNTVSQEILHRRVTARDVSEGMFRFFIGLGKKVILANQLSEISSSFLNGDLSQLSVSGAWIGLLAFAFQIFFDFSGYSDMAIGMGRCLGFHFNENFKHPYTCLTITDFWRKWHISLGTFFRDYVYIPMGGNRRHQYFNILTVWFLTGLWHGAAWNFILWGLYFGLIVTIEKFTVLKISRFVPRPLLHVYALFLVFVGWGIFYFDDLSRMSRFFGVFFGNAAQGFDFVTEAAFFNHFWLWVAAVAFSLPVYAGVCRAWHFVFPVEKAWHGVIMLTVKTVLSLLLLGLSIALLVGATNNAFIYTRF